MKYLSKLLTVFILSVLLWAAIPGSASAYIDPGTGSYIFQLLIAGLLGAAFAAKAFWGNIKTFMVGLFKKSQPSQGDDR